MYEAQLTQMSLSKQTAFFQPTFRVFDRPVNLLAVVGVPTCWFWRFLIKAIFKWKIWIVTEGGMGSGHCLDQIQTQISQMSTITQCIWMIDFGSFFCSFHIGSVLNYLSCIFRWIWLDCTWRRGWKTSPQSCSSQMLRSQRTVFSSSSAPWSRQVRPSRARTHSYTPQGGSLCVGLMNGKHM